MEPIISLAVIRPATTCSGNSLRSSDACRTSRAHAKLASQSGRRWALGKSRVLATLGQVVALLLPPRRHAATVARGDSWNFGAVTHFAEFLKCSEIRNILQIINCFIL